MRRLAFLVILLSVLTLPAPAQAQFTAAWITQPAPNSEFTLMGGAAIPIPIGTRASLGVGGMLGPVFDKADPLYRDDMHAHLTWGPIVQGTFYLTDSIGVTGGHLWGFVPKSAKNHLANYRSWYLGISLR